MALPIIDVPVFDLTLPVSNKKIRYRPFVVKEEKNLLIAMQDDTDAELALNMIEAVVKACTFDAIDSFDSYSQVDMEYLFVQIRNKSMGEGVEVNAKCVQCEKQSVVNLDLSKVKVEMSEHKISPEVQLGDNLWLILHYPSLRATYKLVDTSDDDEILSVIADSIDNIIFGEKSFDPAASTKAELIQWLQSLTRAQFVHLIDFFKTAPKLVYESTFMCPMCRHQNSIRLEGLNDFFG